MTLICHFSGDNWSCSRSGQLVAIKISKFRGIPKARKQAEDVFPREHMNLRVYVKFKMSAGTLIK